MEMEMEIQMEMDPLQFSMRSQFSALSSRRRIEIHLLIGTSACHMSDASEGAWLWGRGARGCVGERHSQLPRVPRFGLK